MIFLDSGAFIALAVANDVHHERALAFHRSTRDVRWTSNMILGETYTHLRYRFGQSIAHRFLADIGTLRGHGLLRVAYVDEALDRVAEGILRQYADVALSYVDATALAWLRTRPDIKRVFGFDRHWGLEGHLLVPNGEA